MMNRRSRCALVGSVVRDRRFGAAAEEQRLPAPFDAKLLWHVSAQGGLRIYTCKKATKSRPKANAAATLYRGLSQTRADSHAIGTPFPGLVPDR